jgi:hypothetical protein
MFGSRAVLNNDGVISKQFDDAPPPGGFSPDIQNGGNTVFDGPFNNSGRGQLNVQVGELTLQDATNSATINLAASATLNVTYPLTLNSGSQFPGAGTIDLRGRSRLIVNTDVTIANIWLNGGTITGPRRVTVTNQLEWSAGSMMGTGSTLIDTNGVLIIDGRPTKSFSDRLLSNFGAYEDGAASTFTRTRASNGQPEDFQESSVTAAYLAASATSLARPFQNTISQAQTNLRAQESAANARYTGAADLLTNTYEGRVTAAVTAYDAAMAAANTLDPTSNAYADAIAAADAARDTSINDAETVFALGEQWAYHVYVSAIQYAANAMTGYAGQVQAAQAAFNRGLRQAAFGGLFGNIDSWAVYMHDLLRGRFPPPPVPPLHAGIGPRPTPIGFLETLSSNARDALAIAYFRHFGIELDADIRATHWWRGSNIVAALHGQPSTGIVPWLLDLRTQAQSWTDSMRNSIQQFADDPGGTVANLASTAWNATVQTVNDGAQMLRNDPLLFLQTAGQVFTNTLTVQANTLTFGLIPGLNAIASDLVASDGFYRGVQVVSIIGREAALAFFTGGSGTIVGAGVRGLALAARFAPPMAGRIATRMLIRAAGRAVATSIIRGSSAVACRITSAYRLAQPYFLYEQVSGMADNLQQARAAINRGDYETAAALMGRTAGSVPHAWASARDAFRLLGALRSLNPQTIGNFLSACFAAGTPILGAGGAKPIEEYAPGERVWARDESDPDGPLELKEIEQIFFTQAPLWHIHVGGQVIRTTAEHPFWVKGRGWTATKDLAISDVLVGHDGAENAVEDLLETGEWQNVYNFRVADHHTYFVGSNEWGFDVWAHNAQCSVVVQHRAGNRQVVTPSGQRWNLPDTKTGGSIPNADPVGDQLQRSVTAAAAQWNRSMLSAAEVNAINSARANGQHWLAALLERQAKGRWVERVVRRDPQLRGIGLEWSSTGPDAYLASNPIVHYDILSGTSWNMDLHARRMATVLFRFITF